MDLVEAEKIFDDSCAVEHNNEKSRKRIVSNENDEAKSAKKSKDESNKERIRKFSQIPIFIVDYHNDVLNFIYRCLASRHIPFQDNVLVHFDSHPDMVISNEIPASACYNKRTMLDELSIENWIMPLCYAGHFNRIVWIKNAWCQQIPNGKYNFVLGHKEDEMRVDCQIEYFISEGNYCNKKDLEAAQNVELEVYDADGINPRQFLTENSNNFILDIDLDFFSTANPFLKIYDDAKCYEQLSEIFKYDKTFILSHCDRTTEQRRKQLGALKNVFEHLNTLRDFSKLPTPYPDIPEKTLAKIRELERSLRAHYEDEDIDWLLVYNSGCTTDSDGLPHHISSQKEIEQYMTSFGNFLKNLPAAPIAVTIACSSEDDYCPKNQVREIEKRVVGLLNEVFGERIHANPIRYYKGDNWDVMKL